MSRMRSIVTGVFLSALWASSPGNAAPICVKTIEGADRLSSGIATATLEDSVLVELCGGGWSRLTLSEGAIRLTAATRSAPSFPAADMLPDGTVTGDRGPIAAAWLTRPTKRYDHGILGDGIEASGMRVLLRNGASLDFNLTGQAVFEDLRVRLVDLDGDGADELISIRSDGRSGAALAVYRLGDQGIGSRVLDMSAVVDWNGDGIPDLALPDNSRRGMKVISLAHGKMEVLATFPHQAPISTAVLAADLDGDGVPELIYGLSDGSLIVTRP